MAGHTYVMGYQSLTQALNDRYLVDGLKEIAKLVCTGVPTRKAEIVEAISTAMLDGNLRTVFNRLSQTDQLAVAEAVHSPEGRIDLRRFESKYLGGRSLGPGHGYRGESALLSLFIIGGQVPADLRGRLEAFAPRPPPDHVRCVEELPESIELATEEGRDPLEIRATPQAALYNLESVLRLIDGGKLKVSQKTGYPTSATERSLSDRLDGGDWYDEADTLGRIGHIQAFAWPVIIQGAGLARVEGSTLRLSNAGRRAIKDPLAEVVKTAWKRWEKTRIIDEFSRINAIKGQKSSRGRALTAPSARRPAINEALCQCPPGEWVKVEELARYMHSEGLDFDVARYAWKLYIGDARYGSLDNYGNWSIVEGRYLLAFLFEYAATLGLIDVAYIDPSGALPDYRGLWGSDDLGFLSRYDGLKYIRVNPLGAFVLGLTDQYLPPTPKTRPVLKVLPNNEIVVTDAVSISQADRLFLDGTCKKVSSSLWRISLRTLLEAAQSGTGTEEVLAFLESRSSEPIPETVSVLLDDAKSRSTRLSYSGRAHLVACKDPLLAQLISSDTKISKLCLPAGDRHIAVLPGREKEFIKALADLGYVVPRLKEQI